MLCNKYNAVMTIAAFNFTCVLLFIWSPASALAEKSTPSFLRLSKSFGRYYCSTDKLVFKENGYFSALQCVSRCSRSPTCFAAGYVPEEHTCNGCMTEFKISNEEMLPSYQYHSQFNIKLVTERKTWADAKINCEELGGRLVAINSDEKQKSVDELVVGLVVGHGLKYIYIGENDIEQEGKFDCIVFRISEKRRLNDYMCDEGRLSVCEFS